MSRRNDFEGNPVRLRAVEPEDGDLWYASGVDSELDPLEWFTHLPSPRSAYRNRAVEASKAPEGDSASLMMETLDGVAVGSLSARANRGTRVFDYGMSTGREHWRQGCRPA